MCDRATELVETIVRVRRGERVLPVTMQMWECLSGCRSDAGDRPLRFINHSLAAVNDEAARMAWKAAFGEEMPEARRPGRKPPEKRSKGVRVMLTGTELRALDQLRGELSRSEYLRRRALDGQNKLA